MDVIVDVQYVSQEENIPSVNQLTLWVEATLKGQRQQAELTIRIVDETESQQLNHQWRNCAYPTNVLSFPFDCPSHLTIPLLGDLVICAPVVAREAVEQHKSLPAHWAHLVIHGTLHLLGYDHQEEISAQIMEQLEIQILQNLGYPNPYDILVETL